MINKYLPLATEIKEVYNQSTDTKLFNLQFIDKKLQRNFSFRNGQFVMVGLPGEGEAAFNICSNPNDSKEFIEISVRLVGRLTEEMHKLKKGDKLWLRGPYGEGWPKFTTLKHKNLLLIGGGCGFVPLRSVILELLDPKNKKIAKNFNTKVFYGCNKLNNLLYKDDLVEWQKKINVQVIFDKETKPKKLKNIKCETGLITKLFDLNEVFQDTTAFLCGPPIMYKFVIKKLKEVGVKDEDIYVSLERRMECGLGVCQHCACGELYVCKDGPVFSYDKIKNSDFI